MSASIAVAEPVLTTPTPLPADRDPCAAYIANADCVTQSIIPDLEGRSIPLRMPAPFFEDYWDRKDGIADTAQLFRVKIGSFQPVSRLETGRRNRQDIWNWVTFVVGNRLPIEDLAVLSADSRFGVIGGNWGRRLDSYTPLQGPFDLFDVHSDAPQPTSAFRTNTFIAQLDDGSVSSVQSCNADDSGTYPICLHWFRASGLDVELDYRRVELPNWQALQSDVIAFLTCATAFGLQR